jgi:hypothetical protein
MALKKTLTYIGIATAGLLFFGRKKYTAAKEIIDNLKVSIKDISNVKLSFKNIKFDAILELRNLTDINFGATLGSAIIIKRIHIFSPSGTLLGVGDTRIFEIELPANGSAELPPITFDLDANTSISEILNNFSDFQNDALNSLHYKIEVEVFGNNFSIDV